MLIVKELRLIRRDPLLLMQLLQQSIYLVPLCLLLWRQPRGGPGAVPWLWLGIILLSGTLATALAWITIAAEDAPELLTAAPLTRALVVRTKIEAALLPLAPLWLAPLLVLGRTHLWFAVSLTLCAFGCSVSTALLDRHLDAALNTLLEEKQRDLQPPPSGQFPEERWDCQGQGGVRAACGSSSCAWPFRFW